MRTIYKYPLDIQDVQYVNAPMGATPLHVDEQFVVLNLWMSIDTDRPNVKHRIVIRGTGHPQRSDDGNYVGTVLMQSGLVWHVFHSQQETAQ